MKEEYKNYQIIISIICISFLQGLQFSVSPVLSQISERYKEININYIQMLVTVPSLTSMLIALLSGGLVAKISKKRLLLVASFIACVSGILPMAGDNFSLLFISRTVYGVALGIAATLNTAVVAEFFEGDKKVTVMGIQGASVGTGMVIITSISGLIGKEDYRNIYWLSVTGLIAFVLLLIYLPETGIVKPKGKGEMKMNKNVFILSSLAAIEFLFLMTFSTNIAMHLSGTLKGDAAVSGILTGVFSGIQIAAGFILGFVKKIMKKLTMSFALLSLAAGLILIALAPSDLFVLISGAIFCGFSQGIFVATGMVEVSDAVAPAGVAKASACFICGVCAGQTLSPLVLNNLSRILFGRADTGYIFLVSATGITVASVFTGLYKCK